MSGSEVYVKVDLVALRALIRDGSVTLKGSRHREPARSVTVWLGLAEDLTRDDDPPLPAVVAPAEAGRYIVGGDGIAYGPFPDMLGWPDRDRDDGLEARHVT